MNPLIKFHKDNSLIFVLMSREIANETAVL
jgi:hypothetical protein